VARIPPGGGNQRGYLGFPPPGNLLMKIYVGDKTFLGSPFPMSAQQLHISILSAQQFQISILSVQQFPIYRFLYSCSTFLSPAPQVRTSILSGQQFDTHILSTYSIAPYTYWYYLLNYSVYLPVISS
jgi:hypothetical protein